MVFLLHYIYQIFDLPNQNLQLRFLCTSISLCCCKPWKARVCVPYGHMLSDPWFPSTEPGPGRSHVISVGLTEAGTHSWLSCPLCSGGKLGFLSQDLHSSLWLLCMPFPALTTPRFGPHRFPLFLLLLVYFKKLLLCYPPIPF